MGLAGAAVIVTASVVTALAYVGSEGERYSPLNHWVSELGEVRDSEHATLFNLGLVVGGLCLAGFMAGLGSLVRTSLGRVSAGIGIAGGLSGALVGVFPMDDLSTHTLVALGFFGLTCIAVTLFTLRPADVPSLRRGRVVAAAALAVGSLLLFLALVIMDAQGDLGSPAERPAFLPVTSIEWLAIGGVTLWVALVAWDLARVPAE